MQRSVPKRCSQSIPLDESDFKTIERRGQRLTSSNLSVCYQLVVKRKSVLAPCRYLLHTVPAPTTTNKDQQNMGEGEGEEEHLQVPFDGSKLVSNRVNQIRMDGQGLEASFQLRDLVAALMPRSMRFGSTWKLSMRRAHQVFQSST